MTEFLDELARSIAKPMPRRRVLRLFGGALVSVAVPGFATATKARAASRFHDCVPKGGELCECNCKGEVCQRICCTPKEVYTCKCGTVAEGAGCKCIRPCGSNTNCCKSGEYCASAKQRLCCKTGTRRCGETCCQPGEKCASPRRSFCCKTSETPCLTKSTAQCCSRGEKCCDGACCTPNQICTKEGCECKRGTSRGRCGGDCCHPTRDKCCPGSRPGTKHCLRKTRVCCGASSCPPGGRCCSEDRETCARNGQRCCGATPYDPAAQKCCGGDYLCGKDDTCCKGSLCCGPDQDCTPEGCKTPSEARALRRRSAATRRRASAVKG